MKKFDLVIFDLDGTILDTLPDLSAAVNDALARRGLPGHTVEEYKKMVGNGVRNLCLQALGDPSEEVLEASLRDFKNYYVSHIDVQTRPYEGMPELLRDLQLAGRIQQIHGRNENALQPFLSLYSAGAGPGRDRGDAA